MIPVFKPSFGEEEFQAVKKTLESGWVGLGPVTQEFEEKFASYLGVNHAVGLNSCTAALHLALKVLDVEGGEVITTPMTFVSTNHAILYNNAIPVFCDIEEDTLNIDADKIEGLITGKTKAILVVHYGGHACDMDPIMSLARKYDLKVVEDCAHACGGEYKGRKLGSIGHLGCFSFHAVKNLAAGEGGMITTNDAETDVRLRKLRWLGISKDTWNRSEIEGEYSWFYTVEEVGFKCHMNDIPAAIGLVQLRRLESLNAKRREIVEKYNKAFEELEGLEIPVQKPYARSCCHNYVVKLDRRDDLMSHLAENGIATSVHYFPNHLYDLYSRYTRRLPVAEAAWKRIVTLPLYPELPAEDVTNIIDVVKKFY